ncbi:MAG: hypothetical protein AAGI46_05595 [Planctomycetota bacterium]
MLNHSLSTLAAVIAFAGCASVAQSSTILFEEDFEDASTDFNGNIDIVPAPLTPTGASGTGVGALVIDVPAGTGTGSTVRDTTVIDDPNRPIAALPPGVSEFTLSFKYAAAQAEVGTQFVDFSFFFTDGVNLTGGGNVTRVNIDRENFGGNEDTAFITITEVVNAQAAIDNGHNVLTNIELTYVYENPTLGSSPQSFTAFVDDIQITAVPEPGAAAAAGLLGLALMKRTR